MLYIPNGSTGTPPIFKNNIIIVEDIICINETTDGSGKYS